MKAPITTAQAMSHPDVVLTINALGKIADELRAENEKLRGALETIINIKFSNWSDGEMRVIARAALGEKS